jgi:acyl-CoA synthetase (AMP-forming)/AMP-acid ligase II
MMLFRRPCHLSQGVRYTHRSNFLHALITTAPDALALSASSTILMVVPMFHANSWGLNFSGAALMLMFALSLCRSSGCAIASVAMHLCDARSFCAVTYKHKPAMAINLCTIARQLCA